MMRSADIGFYSSQFRDGGEKGSRSRRAKLEELSVLVVREILRDDAQRRYWFLRQSASGWQRKRLKIKAREARRIERTGRT